MKLGDWGKKENRVNRMCSRLLLGFGLIKVAVLLLTFLVFPFIDGGFSTSEILDDLGFVCFGLFFMAIGGLPYFILSGIASGARFPLIVTIPAVLLFAFDAWFYLAVFFLMEDPDPQIGIAFFIMNIVFVGIGVGIAIFGGAVNVMLGLAIKEKKR